MTNEQALYIVFILNTFPDNLFWRGATETDVAEHQKISNRYAEMRMDMLFSDAMAIAKAEFIQRIARDGIPAGAGIAGINKLTDEVQP